MQKKNQTITIQVTAEDKEMAQKLARLECRSVSGYLRQLLRQEIRNPPPRPFLSRRFLWKESGAAGGTGIPDHEKRTP